MQVTIDTASRDEAETLAASLPGAPLATSVRGYGLIRLRCRDRKEMHAVIAAVDEAVQRLELPWARVRHGDEEQMFRGRLRRNA